MRLHNKYLLFLSSTIAAVLLVLIILHVEHKTPRPPFAQNDKILANGSLELCSPYAKLCFTRPANWTRSSILHAGLAKQNDIEINPPTGTILRFEAISNDTNTVCQTGYTCDIYITAIAKLENGLYSISGTSNAAAQDSDTPSSHIPFVQLMRPSDVRSFDLQVGKYTPFANFNPGISFDAGPEIMLQVSPSKGYSSVKAQQWLASDECNKAKQILASVRAF